MGSDLEVKVSSCKVCGLVIFERFERPVIELQSKCPRCESLECETLAEHALLPLSVIVKEF